MIPSAEIPVEACVSLMLDFMPKTDKKSEISCGLLVQRARTLIKTSLKFPVLIGSVFGAIDDTFFGFLLKVSIFDFL